MAAQPIAMEGTPDREVRGTGVTTTVVDRLKAAPQLSLVEVSADTSAQPRETVVSTDGLPYAADRLSRACRGELL